METTDSFIEKQKLSPKNITVKKKEIKLRCPKGTRRSKKTGLCEKVNDDDNSQENTKDNKTIIATKKDKITGERKKIKLIIEESTSPEKIELEVIDDEDKNEKKINDNKTKLELAERESFLKDNMDLPYLYPNINDPNFNIKIAERKEFNDTQYDGEIKDAEKEADIMCNADFELAPHQLFVRNFLSFQTPYNSLLLYHGLGSGKTCSAISIAEEMRDYLIQMNISNRIIVVASPNVQDNFKLQLFDEKKLKLVDGLWNIRACTGNKFLKEINPMSMKGLSEKTVISQVKRIINNYYLFLGYTEFANYIKKKSTVGDDITDQKKRATIIKNKLKHYFSNRLIIIDEVHNIRITDDNPDKKHIAQELFKLVKNADNMRFLLLSATPLYNSYKEIIWLINLMNINDRRSTIEGNDVFNNDGSFKTSASGEEIGKELLIRKATGYISYVRGENPYTFPYKIWPDEFSPENTFKNHPNPMIQINGKPIIQPIEFLSLYLVKLGSYQEKCYRYILNSLKQKQDIKKTTAFDELDAFGYTVLQKPIEALNIVYPDERLLIENPEIDSQTKSNIDLSDIVGSGGLSRVMNYTVTNSPAGRYDFEYKEPKYGNIFSQSEIGKYSGKIKRICERIIMSEGVVLVYSQYIDGGLVPIALALEELGFTRSGSVRSLFKTPPREKIDAITFKTKKEMLEQNKSPLLFHPAKYVMITGDKGLSPDNVKDISAITDLNNKNGQQVKVVLISLAGSEGLDLKFIRQVHILDPWYNMNRTEQIIGRAVRTCSHKDLPFKKRNVELYLYGSLLNDEREEAADLYVYRLAELKAKQIGNVTRVIKEIAVDCILNYQQLNFSVENMKQKVILELSSGIKLNYDIGDKPFTAICDYMKKCNYTCNPTKEIKEEDINSTTYGEAFIMMNNERLIYRIKTLMKERFFYRKQMLVSMINVVKTYPIIQINAALNQLVEEKNEYITDKYGRLGKLVNIGDLYLFQPLELTNKHIGLLERSSPIDYKHESINIDLDKVMPHMRKNIETNVIIKIPIKKDKKEKDKKNEDTKDTDKPIKIQKDKPTILLDKMRENYTIATIPQKPKRGEENWYKFSSEVIQEMEGLGFNRENLLISVIQHICDDLSFDEKQKIISVLPKLKETDLFEKTVKNYFKIRMLENKGITGIFLENKGTNMLYIKNKTNESKWTLAEAEDINDLSDKIEELKNRFLPVAGKLNNVVGFMSIFKKDANNIVFKTKVFKMNGVVKKRNKGTRCYGKSIEMMKEIMSDDIYIEYLDFIHEKYKDIIEEKQKNRELNDNADAIPDELEAINQTHACVVQEMFLRFYNVENKEKKQWFLTPEEAILIDIENLSL